MTRGLVVLNVAAFALELHQGANLQAFIYRFGVVPNRWAIASASYLLEWPSLFLSLLTSQFLHGGFLHLAGNLLYLWIFGDNVEDRLGPAQFLGLYLSCGVAAAVIQVLVLPGLSIPMVGASGAVAGILGAYFLMFPSARIVTLIPFGFFWDTMEVPAFLFLGFWFLLQWLAGLTTIGQVTGVGGVAFWAHVGGFVSGMAGLAFVRTRRRRW